MDRMIKFVPASADAIVRFVPNATEEKLAAELKKILPADAIRRPEDGKVKSPDGGCYGWCYVHDVPPEVMNERAEQVMFEALGLLS